MVETRRFFADALDALPAIGTRFFERLAKAVDALPLGTFLSFVARLFRNTAIFASDEASVVVTTRIHTGLVCQTINRCAGIDNFVDASLSGFVTDFVVGAYFGAAKVFANLVDAFLRFGTQRAGIDRLVDASLSGVVADFVVGTHFGTTKVFAHIVDAFLQFCTNLIAALLAGRT